MDPSPAATLATFLDTVDPTYHPVVRAVHEATLASGVPFDVAIKYRMLTYTRERDWRHWVVAVSQMKKAVNVRFLAGTLLDDPRGLLRAGTSHLKTLDIPTLEAFEADVVTAFARQASGLYEYVRDHGDELPRA